MKQTQNEPKSALENHQKNPAKNQMVMRCKIILLKQAIQDAEAIVLKQIGTLSLSNIEAAIGHLVDAKYTAKIALQDGFMSVALLDRIRKSLEYAGRKINIPEVRDTWYLANELERLMPTYEVKQGVPMYIMKNYPIEGAK